MQRFGTTPSRSLPFRGILTIRRGVLYSQYDFGGKDIHSNAEEEQDQEEKQEEVEEEELEEPEQEQEQE